MLCVNILRLLYDTTHLYSHREVITLLKVKIVEKSTARKNYTGSWKVPIFTFFGRTLQELCGICGICRSKDINEFLFHIKRLNLK